MVLTSIQFDNKGEDFCYRYEIGKFTTSEYLKRLSLLQLSFNSQAVDKIYHNLDKELFALYGITIDIIEYPYAKQILFAISDSIDELSILADLRGLTPIVNKV